MRKLFLALAILVTAAPMLAEGKSDRDLQWIYRDKLGSGSESPSAAFLSWNYASVILLATCKADEHGGDGKAGNGGITLHYFPDPPTVKIDKDGYYLPAKFPDFSFSRGGTTVRFPATVKKQSVRGDLNVTARLLALLKPGKDDLEIYAAMEMGDPWYVGQAEPLYRLALTCKVP
ncbi:MAG: hypothetical protein V3V15_10285 [Sphingorhabdus sp.]